MNKRIFIILNIYVSFSICLAGCTVSPPIIARTNAAQVSELARLGKGWTHGIAWSTDGKMIAVASSIGIYLYDPETLKEIRFVDTKEWIQSVYFSPNGQVLASVSWTEDSNQLRLWDTNSGKLLFTLEKGVERLAFSPDGNIIATTIQSAVQLWDTNSGKLLRGFNVQPGTMPGVCFTPNGLLIITSIGVWDLKSDKLLSKLHLGPMESLALSPDGQTMVWASYNSTISLTNVFSGQELHQLEGEKSLLTWNLAFSPDGQLIASGGSDNLVRIWDGNTGKRLHALEGHKAWAYSVAFSPDGKTLASAGWDATVRFWDAQTGKPLKVLSGHTPNVDELVIGREGHLLIANTRGHDKNNQYETWGSVRIWELPEKQLIATFDEQQYSIAISSDEQTLALGGNYPNTAVDLLDIHTGEILHEFEGNKYSVGSIAFSPNGDLLAAGGEDYIVRIWNVHTGQLLHTLMGHGLAISSVVFSPDGKLLASAGGHDQTICLWNVSSGKQLRTIQGPGDVYALAFSPDGKQLALSSWEDIEIRDVNSGQLLRTLKGHKMAVLTVAFSPDGQILASGGWDKIIRLWDISTGQLLTILEGHTEDVTSLVFYPDGTTLASGSIDGTIRLWGIQAK
jgi:WD40 repeat protein